MGMNFDFSKIISKFEELEKKSQNSMAENALNAGADILVEELKQEIASNVYDTGKLYESIGKSKITGSGANKKIEIGSQSNNTEIIARNFYQEHGNAYMIGKKHNKRAFDNSKKEANEKIKESLIKDLFE